jgi:hypothetical protein
MSFEDLIGAVRAADGEDPERFAATQLRVRRSLETRARSRHRLVGIMTTVAVLFAGTASWALATGQVASLWAPGPLPSTVEVAPAPVPAPHHRSGSKPVPGPELTIVPSSPLPPEAVTPPETVTPPVPPPLPPPPRLPASAPRPLAHPVARSPVEVLYRKAHDLHFHGGDPATALAAWDAYLAAEPTGRFSVEARYNRALLLVRLGRYLDARAALMAFSRGEIEPAGYRQAEAEQLVERLAHYE